MSPNNRVMTARETIPKKVAKPRSEESLPDAQRSTSGQPSEASPRKTSPAVKPSLKSRIWPMIRQKASLAELAWSASGAFSSALSETARSSLSFLQSLNVTKTEAIAENSISEFGHCTEPQILDYEIPAQAPVMALLQPESGKFVLERQLFRFEEHLHEIEQFLSGDGQLPADQSLSSFEVNKRILETLRRCRSRIDKIIGEDSPSDSSDDEYMIYYVDGKVVKPHRF